MIDWEQTNLNEMRDLEDTYLYALSRGKSLMYIGMTHSQDIIDEIKQTVRSFEIEPKGLSIWFGYPEKKKGNLSKALIQDIEALLIFSHEPPYNTQHLKTYSGRDMVVKNRGYNHLFRKVKSKHEDVNWTN